MDRGCNPGVAGTVMISEGALSHATAKDRLQVEIGRFISNAAKLGKLLCDSLSSLEILIMHSPRPCTPSCILSRQVYPLPVCRTLRSLFTCYMHCALLGRWCCFCRLCDGCLVVGVVVVVVTAYPHSSDSLATQANPLLFLKPESWTWVFLCVVLQRLEHKLGM